MVDDLAADLCAYMDDYKWSSSGVLFKKRYHVNLLTQGSTADIFLGNFRLFLTKHFPKNTSERLIRKGVYLFSKPNYYYFSRATVEV